MIRRLLKKAAGRALRRDQTAPAPRPHPTPASTAEPSTAEPEEQLDIEVDGEQLGAWMSDGQKLVLLDIREPHELQHGVARNALVIRMNDIPSRIDDLPNLDTRMVVYCAAGGRSFSVTAWLRDQGWADSWSLSGGYHDYLSVGGAVTSWPPETSLLGCELADISAIEATIKQSGRPLLVNHWATWCDGCVEELPLLLALHEQFGESVEFIGINWDRFQGTDTGTALIQKVEEVSQEHGLAWRSLIVDAEPEALFQALDMQCQTIPQVWLVDSSGRVVHRVEVVLDKAGLSDLSEQISTLS